MRSRRDGTGLSEHHSKPFGIIEDVGDDVARAGERKDILVGLRLVFPRALIEEIAPGEMLCAFLRVGEREIRRFHPQGLPDSAGEEVAEPLTS